MGYPTSETILKYAFFKSATNDQYDFGLWALCQFYFLDLWGEYTSFHPKLNYYFSFFPLPSRKLKGRKIKVS